MEQDVTVPLIVKAMLWFYQGFQPVSALMALINLGLILSLWMNSKGFSLSAWMIPVMAAMLLIGIIVTGYLLQRYGYTQKMLTHSNLTQNQEMALLLKKVDAICRDHNIKTNEETDNGE